MAAQLLSTSALTVLLIIVAFSTLILRRLWTSHSRQLKQNKHNDLGTVQHASLLVQSLASALADSVILPQQGAAFEQSTNAYWAKQETEAVPACIVRPRNAAQLCTAITILKREYDQRRQQGKERQLDTGLFAVRGGGHCPNPGAASTEGGVLIDLSRFDEIVPSEDGTSVLIGAGAKWTDVYKVLDSRGLGVVGGRNGAVGVGGFILGGGIAYYSPRAGLSCSAVISCEVVLASGQLVTASEQDNPDLWRALKGGSNNFGIVTRFVVRSFPASNVWSGFIFLLPFQAAKVLKAFHDFVGRSNSGDPDTRYDEHAAGPAACFSYVHAIRMQAISVNLTHTKPSGDGWPTCWKTSSFHSLWRVWSTCKNQSLVSAVEENTALNPPGRRQVFATTTIKNDPATIAAAHGAYLDAIDAIRKVNVKGVIWTLVLQPLLPAWVNKGDPNPLGFHDCTDEPLVLVSLTANWPDRKHDAFVRGTTRRAVDQMDNFAATNGTGHPYRYLNYCAEWQQPLQSYGTENFQFLQEVSRKYDPERLFQKGCPGGFKLDVVDAQA